MAAPSDADRADRHHPHSTQGCYAGLEAANKSNHVTSWLTLFAGMAVEAHLRTAASIEFLVDKTRLLDRLRAHLNQRAVSNS